MKHSEELRGRAEVMIVQQRRLLGAPVQPFCHTCVHSNHPSGAPITTCTSFLCKERGRKRGEGLSVSDEDSISEDKM